MADLRRLGPELVSASTSVTGSMRPLLEAVLLAGGLALVHVPGLAVNRAAHGFAGGERKSDPRDARAGPDRARGHGGGFELTVAAAVAAAGMPLAIVNPAQIRAFARAVGRLAKADRLDAEPIARFAEQVRPVPRPVERSICFRCRVSREAASVRLPR